MFTYANADTGGKIVNKEIEKFCQEDCNKYKVVKSLGQLRYLSAMKYTDVLIGNTSSGIIEAASFNKPVINIGDRQKGRQRSGNIIDCKIDSLEESISFALSVDFQEEVQKVKNIYGTGNSSRRIVNELIRQPLSVVKKFVDIK